MLAPAPPMFFSTLVCNLALHASLVGGTASAALPSDPDTVPGFHLVEEVRVRSEDVEEAPFTDLTDLAEGPDGTIFAVEPQAKRILIFDRKGRPAGEIGREGDGPGEFRRPVQIGWLGDTLWVRDRRLRRVSLFARSGAFLSTVRIPSVQGSEGHFWAGAAAMLADGSVLGYFTVDSRLVAAGRVDAAPLVRVARDGERVDTLAWYSMEHHTLELARGSGLSRIVSYVTQPFSDGTLWAGAPDGRFLVLVERRTSSRDEAGQPLFRVIKVAPSGDTLLAHGYPFTPKTLGREEIDRAVEELAVRLERRRPSSGARVAPGRMRAMIRQRLFTPEHHPPVSAVHVASHGAIWLCRERDASACAHWWILDGDGTLIAQVPEPPPGRLLHAGSEHVWFLERDALDVPSLVRYGGVP